MGRAKRGIIAAALPFFFSLTLAPDRTGRLIRLLNTMPLPPTALHTPARGADAADLQALRQCLQARGQRHAQLLQTHISWLLLGHEQAWKIKKPVRLPFADFSTLAQRRHFCEEELRLNQRLAPQLYLDVQPLWRNAQGLLDFDPPAPDQPAAEWAVRMRRFADDALLRPRFEAGAAPPPAALHQLGQRLARFHAQGAGAAVPQAEYGSAERIEADVRALFTPLQRSAFAELVPQWQAWLERQCAALRPIWQARRAGGFVREGHGDLHLGNLVLLGDAIVPFDCIEFQPAMRWIDVANDMAFLSMDLHANGRSDLAAHAMDGWLQHSGDFAALQTWRFYEVYRALVRAMVAQISPPAAGPAGADAPPAGQQYAHCAQQWCQATPAPALFITCGASGSGKSTVAAACMEQLGAIRIRSDVERKRLFGLDALANSHAQGRDIYTPEATQRTFARLGELAELTLQAGWPVVVDAAFLRREQRDALRALAQRLRLPFAILACEAPAETLRQRIAQRRSAAQDPSEATPELVQQQLQGWQPWGEEELPFVRRIDTSAPHWRAALAAQLQTPR